MNSKLTQVRSAGQDKVVSPVDSGSMLFQNIKVGAVKPGGESWYYTWRCYPRGKNAGNAGQEDQCNTLGVRRTRNKT